MRSLASLAALLLLVAPISGCVSRPDPAEPPTPFVFRSLNLREQDRQGRPAWRVTSPEARYDLNRRVATAVDPVGVVFAAGQPLYELTAQRATVINDGEVIQLEGAVRIRRLGNRPVLVQAERLRWYPARAWIDLEHRPSIREGFSQVRADQASINLSTEVVQLKSRPVFERWGPEAGQQPNTSPPPLRLQASRAEWSLRSGAWTAEGPIKGQRRLPGQTAPQTLTASSMRGNSSQQTLDLLAPVQLLDPGQNTRIAAELTQIDLAAQTIRSERPVQATIGKLLVTGNRVLLNLKQTDVLISEACRIRQPGTELMAGRCQWNWVSRVISANDNVLLRRAANGQITRSQALSGRLGTDGEVVFFTPGGRVQSELRVQGSGQGRSRPRAAIVP